MICDENANVQIFEFKEQTFEKLREIEEFRKNNKQKKIQQNTLYSRRKVNFTQIKDEEDVKNVNGPVNCITFQTTDNTRFAVAGRENEIHVYDSKLNVVWRSRNVKNDRLNMKVPIWYTSLQFIPHKKNLLAAATNYHELRFYDLGLKRRPILNCTKIDENAFVTIYCPENQDFLYLSTSTGSLMKINLSTGIRISNLRGPSGSIRR